MAIFTRISAIPQIYEQLDKFLDKELDRQLFDLPELQQDEEE